MSIFRSKAFSILVLVAFISLSFHVDVMAWPKLPKIELKKPKLPKILKLPGTITKRTAVIRSELKDDVLNGTVKLAKEIGRNKAENVAKTIVDPVIITTETKQVFS